MFSKRGKIKNELIEDGDELLWAYNYDFGIAIDLIDRLLDYIDKTRSQKIMMIILLSKQLKNGSKERQITATIRL